MDEFETYSKFINQLENFYSDYSLFLSVNFNYRDLREKEKFYINQYSTNPGLDFNKFSTQYIDINRLILNLLSSIRTYLDHTETKLKRSFGNDSAEFGLFKKLTSDCFDNNFAYRFLSKLRNYSQHCGLPIGSMSMTDSETGQFLKILLVRDRLLENFDSWGTIVKPELQTQDELFDIFPLFEKQVTLLRNVNEELYEMLLRKLTNHGYKLLDLIIETQQKEPGIPCLLKISGPYESPNMQIKWFPIEIISKITNVKINTEYTGE